MTGGVPLTAACNLLFWFILVTWMLGRPHAVEVVFPPVTYYVCLVLLLIGAPMSIFVGLIVAQALGKPHLWWAAALVPLYWFLQSIAAVKAIYQLVTRPCFWEKTVHGLSDPPRVPRADRSTFMRAFFAHSGHHRHGWPSACGHRCWARQPHRRKPIQTVKWPLSRPRPSLRG